MNGEIELIQSLDIAIVLANAVQVSDDPAAFPIRMQTWDFFEIRNHVG